MYYKLGHVLQIITIEQLLQIGGVIVDDLISMKV